MATVITINVVMKIHTRKKKRKKTIITIMDMAIKKKNIVMTTVTLIRNQLKSMDINIAMKTYTVYSCMY